ncbi:hypothetical protein BN903_150 [Halorubrum sp. AJ67]|nr:hypothetical protein BN903_150 [Halorubrum sp. AJ67]
MYPFLMDKMAEQFLEPEISKTQQQIQPRKWNNGSSCHPVEDPADEGGYFLHMCDQLAIGSGVVSPISRWC